MAAVVGRRAIRSTGPGAGVLDIVGLQACAVHVGPVSNYLGEYSGVWSGPIEEWRTYAGQLRESLGEMGSAVHVHSLERPRKRYLSAVS